MGDIECTELGQDWYCETRLGCCIYNPPSCETPCRESPSVCGELGLGWSCVDGCCENTGTTCDHPCETLSGCSELGASWICDTAALCCVDLAAPDAGGSDASSNADVGALESDAASETPPGTNPPVRIVSSNRRPDCRCSASYAERSPPYGVLFLLLAFAARRIDRRR
jgi:hypothetical protein